MSVNLIEKKSAFKRRIRTYALQNHGHKDVNSFFKDAYKLFERETNKIMSELLMIRVNVCMELKFLKRSIVQRKSGEEIKDEEMTFFFQTSNEKILANTKLNEWYTNNIVDPINKKN